jgi:hypothetical protein
LSGGITVGVFLGGVGGVGWGAHDRALVIGIFAAG